jgi:hypothetical protein
MKQHCAPRPLAGEVGERSKPGEGATVGTLTRSADALRPLPQAGEVYKVRRI